MKSIKPGRGPSMMGAAGAVFAAIFGIIWIGAAVSIGAPGFFPLFGVAFVGIAVFQAVYHFRNATGENRYSVFDIVESGEEPDPLAFRIEEAKEERREPEGDPAGEAAGFCPYCGEKAEEGYVYCAGCGKRLPGR